MGFWIFSILIIILSVAFFFGFIYLIFKMFFKAFAKPLTLVSDAIKKASEAQARRLKDLEAWATSKQLQFDPAQDYAIAQQLSDLECLNRGEDRYVYNRTFGEWQRFSYLGSDYHFVTYSETSSTDSIGRESRQTNHHQFSAVVLASKMPLRPLFLRPEGILDQIPQLLGFEDIDFESPEFSRSFYVKAPDKRWAYDVFHPLMMEFLLKSPRFTIEFGRDHLIAYKTTTGTTIFSVEEFQAAAEVLAGILERLPNYLMRQQGSLS